MTDKKYKSIVERLTITRNRDAFWHALEGFIDLLTFIFAFVFLLWLTTWLFWPASALRVIILIAGIVCVLAIIARGAVKPLVSRSPLAEIAIRLERFYGKLQSRLIASLQLYDKLVANKENYSGALIEKTIEEAGGEIKHLDFGVVIEKNKKPYQRLSLSILMVVLCLILSIQTFNHTRRLYLHPLANIPKPSNLVLTVDPVTAEVVKNDDVTVEITASGEKVRRIDFNFRFDDEQWIKVPAEKSTDDSGVCDGIYTYKFRKLKRNIEYFAQAKHVRSPIGNITVINPPRLVDVSIELDFPRYTRLEHQVLPNNDGSVTALKGTVVNFNGRLNKPVENAVMVFDDGSRKKMAVQTERINGKFVLDKSGSYHIEVEDSKNLKNPQPIEYDLVCLEDYSPRVEITFPAVDIDLDENMTVPLEAGIYDDFGFSKVELVYWTFSEGHQSDRTEKVLQTDFGDVTEILVGYDWYVEQLHLLPGDLIYYYIEVFDNDVISGPKSSVSKTYSARLPGLDEIMADITNSQEEVFKEFERAADSQRQLRDELENISREIMKFSEIDWERKQQIQQALSRQKKIAEQLERVAQQMDENIEKLDKNQLATLEMLDKMEEIKQLMEQVATPELKKAMEKLQEALRQMDPDMLKEAMKNFNFSVEQINEQLDRTLALLKKFQLEQKLDTLAKMAQKLAEQQQQINDKLDMCDSEKEVSDLQQPQQSQKQGLESMKDQFKQADSLNQELGMLPQQDMDKANEMLNSPQMNNQMNQMMQNLNMCNKQGARMLGQNLQQDFENMAQMFQTMLEQMQSQQQQMITGMLKKAIADILYLSQNQEALSDSTRSIGKRLESLREMASQQKDLQSATDRVAGSVSDLTKETLFVSFTIMERLGEALRQMQAALENLNNRRASRAKNNQVEAMTALNQTVMLLMNSLDQACQCQSGTGMQSFMQSLNQMAQQQQALNQQAQSLIPMPGQTMTMMQYQGLQRLAAQQETIRKGLQELMEEYGESGNILGRLSKLGEEMKKVAEELRSKDADRSIIQRQERILSRLLDAQKSVHRRDYSRKRQARAGKDITRRGPDALKPGNSKDEQLAEDIKKALSEKYPRRYENLIKEYFKALTEDITIEQ